MQISLRPASQVDVHGVPQRTLFIDYARRLERTMTYWTGTRGQGIFEENLAATGAIGRDVIGAPLCADSVFRRKRLRDM
jgi:hypothetical protein